MSYIKAKILLVEDNMGDIVLIKEALKDNKINNELEVVMDGESAMKLLKKSLETKNYPDIILLDINIPEIDGKEILHFIKTNENLKRIPVIMLTSSSSPKDILDSYEGFANCFITKPVNLDKFINVIHTIEDFWLSIVKLPKDLL